MSKRLHLFEGYGVELEYMIVDRDTLAIKSIAELPLTNANGEIEGEMDKGLTAWSNELVSHVLELKSNGPTGDLVALRDKFNADIAEVNEILANQNAMLLSSAAHPWMNPAKETKLWQHESQEIYHTYDRIFGCKGHGWSNLQSTHINLPFYDDEEFSKLHTAIRFMMPMIPALTASSPVLDGKFTGYYDKRLYYYEKNQSKIPVLTGKVVPERLFTKHAYQKHVYDKISAAIKPFDTDNILKPVWLNSRGAMARFDRGAIEIRIIDIQECPSADLAIVALITELVKVLVKEKWVSFQVQQSFETEELHQLLKGTVKQAGKYVISDPTYLSAWGLTAPVTGQEFWQMVLEKLGDNQALVSWKPILHQLISAGTLAERIYTALNEDYSREKLHAVYAAIADSLKSDELFRR
ncbi:carboxylate-amine ligase [Marinoscillum sp.]|uniref:carboxylate-amine ligase n=1 Tax=Marinoscillum sp. TaxID=2024838 RepID=UPI003BAD8F09